MLEVSIGGGYGGDEVRVEGWLGKMIVVVVVVR